MDGLKSGFFINFYHNTRNALKSDEIQAFTALANNQDRFKLAHNACKFEEKLGLKRHERNSKHQLNKDEINFYKDQNCALEMKKVGNKFFQGKQWKEALNFYNKSYLMLPAEEANDIAIIFANRSAVLYHQEQYDAALKEIERAIEANYPKDMMYKLKERKARCLLAKKSLREALKAFQEDVQALDDSNLPNDKRSKLERDAQIMIKMLTKNCEMEAKLMKNQPTPVPAAAKKPKEAVVEHFVSDTLTFDYNESEGRFAKAAADIKLGTSLVREKPHVACLVQVYSQTHCQLCFKRTNLPIACPTCADVIFCSEKCRNEACSSFHRSECGIMQHLWNSGVSITCQMALRAISQQSLQYFKDIKQELESLREKADYERTDKYPSGDYRRVFNLVTHEKDRNFEDVFHRIVMASFLTHCLKLGGFFEGDDSDESFNYIGSLMYHNLQFMQFNAHEISELQYKGKTDTVGTSVFIGGGLYPTVAFFNHSCDPGVVRYFNGNVVTLRAIKKIPAGEVVAENYGPIFTQVSKDERQSHLLNQYRFSCFCTPCMENWPTFNEMDDSFLRFRCDSGVSECKNVLIVPLDTNEFMIKCTECGESTNIMKGLKSLQDTDMLFKMATKQHEAGDIKGALSKYVENLDLLDKTLVPPFRSFHLTQQGIRRCIIDFGNKAYI